MATNNKETTEPADLNNLSCRDLRAFLRDRGQRVSGTKADLLARIAGAQKLGLPTLQEVAEQDRRISEERKSTRFHTALGEDLPNPWKLHDSWEKDVEKIPSVRSSDLYNYLILNRERTFDCGKMQAKRQLKAKVFYEDNHVYSIQYHDISDTCSHCYVRCKVIPSLPTGSEKQKPDYHTWVSLSKVTGNVHSAGCTCSAGEGESCNHVAALLYAVVDITEKKADGLQASTSKTCKWNQPRKRKISPKKAQHLTFKKHKFDTTSLNSETRRTPARRRIDTCANIEPVDTTDFASKLKDCAPHAAFLKSNSLFTNSLDSGATTPLPQLHDVNFMYADYVNLNSEDCVTHFDTYFSELSCSTSVCTTIEQETRGQSKNDNWKLARSGRLTSSNFGLLCKQKDSTKPDAMLKTIMNYKEFEVTSVRWGNSHESAARRVYSRTIQRRHPHLKVFNCGLLVDPSFPHLGSSPDAVVHCPHCIDQDGLLEIKCPYRWRNVTPEEAAKDKAFCCELEDGKMKLKRTHNYYYQIQGQLGITQRKWCDFFIWTLKGHSTERIYFDTAFWAQMLVKLNKFYRKAVIPELFSERVKRGLSLYKEF